LEDSKTKPQTSDDLPHIISMPTPNCLVFSSTVQICSHIE